MNTAHANIPTPTPEDPLRQERQWWMDRAALDFERAARGLKEYGSADLVMMGAGMDAIGAVPAENPSGYKPSPRIGQIQAIMFYAMGKVARAIESGRTGILPSDDTLLDLRVYSFMAQFAAEWGSWRTLEAGEYLEEDEVAS